MDENTEDGDKPPVINGYAVPIREGTMKSARPGQRTLPMETDDSVGPGGDAGLNSTYPQEAVRESIAEEDELGELGGTGPLIPPPQGFRGSSQQGGRPLSQSMPQVSGELKEFYGCGCFIFRT